MDGEGRVHPLPAGYDIRKLLKEEVDYSHYFPDCVNAFKQYYAEKK